MDVNTETPVHYGRGLNRILSNFAHTPMVFRGVEFQSAEGAYHAFKTGQYVAGFQNLWGLTALRRARRLGLRSISDPLPLMAEILQAKWEQVPEFREALQEAGVLSHAVGNAFWASEFPRLLDELRQRNA